MIDISADHRTIITTILTRFVPDMEVYAFGSRTTGTAKPHSDLDLVIIGSSRVDKKIMRALQAALEESDIPFRVDVVDWNAVSENFKIIIARHAVPFLATQSPQNTSSPMNTITG